jgi:hypothetical protein
MRRAFTVAMLLGLSACNAGKIRVEPVPAPAARRDPVADALTALGTDDRRLLVVGGVWVWRVPGISRTCAAKLRGHQRVRYIQFISDVIHLPQDATEAARQDSLRAEAAAAEAYARRYNVIIADSTRACDPPSGTDRD